jgi:hypothetical protein
MLNTPRETLHRLRNALALTLLLLVVRMLPSVNFPNYQTGDSIQHDVEAICKSCLPLAWHHFHRPLSSLTSR